MSKRAAANEPSIRKDTTKQQWYMSMTCYTSSYKKGKVRFATGYDSEAAAQREQPLFKFAAQHGGKWQWENITKEMTPDEVKARNQYYHDERKKSGTGSPARQKQRAQTVVNASEKQQHKSVQRQQYRALKRQHFFNLLEAGGKDAIGRHLRAMQRSKEENRPPPSLTLGERFDYLTKERLPKLDALIAETTARADLLNRHGFAGTGYKLIVRDGESAPRSDLTEDDFTAKQNGRACARTTQERKTTHRNVMETELGFLKEIERSGV